MKKKLPRWLYLLLLSPYVLYLRLAALLYQIMPSADGYTRGAEASSGTYLGSFLILTLVVLAIIALVKYIMKG